MAISASLRVGGESSVFFTRALATESKEKMVDTQQRRKRVAWEHVESEQSVFIDILSRLPVQSIRSLRTTNKYWYGSIRTKLLANKQLNRSRENPGFIACRTLDSTMELYSMKLGSFKFSYVNEINPSEKRDGDYMHLVSSFNGLICCTNQICGEEAKDDLFDLQIWICNPCTGETLLLPQGRPSYKLVPRVGVAYYSDMSDYKVFRIFCAGKKSHEGRVACEGEVYSSDTGSWKNIGPVPCIPTDMPFRTAHVFIGGKIYWLSFLDDLPSKILSVDLSGRFEVIQLPEYSEDLRDEDRITEPTHLINLKGALAIVVIHPSYMDIWEWKEGDEKSSTWVLDYVDKTPITDFEMVLAMTSSGNQIIIMTDERWYSFDVDTRKWRKKRENSREFVNPSVFPFTESVLPCNGGMML